MPYLLLDPVNDYAAYQKRFLDGLGLPAVALFSSGGRHSQWKHKWERELGENVVGEHVVDRDALGELATTLGEEHPEGFFGLVPWDETHIILAAEIGEALQLDWNPRDVIERCRDKSLMKAWLRETCTARINRSRVVTNADEALEFQAEVGSWPIVVKPSGGAGSISVFFAHDGGQLLHGCQRVLEAGLGEVLLEEYVGGDEYAVNGLVDHDGGVLITDVWRYDKRDSHGERNLYYESIKLSSHEDPFPAIAEYAAHIVTALDLRRSPIHMEVKVDDDGPCLIEIGARFAGGNQPVLASKLHRHSLFELAACHYLDDLRISPLDVDYERYDALSSRILSGIQEVEIPRIEAVVGIPEVERLPSFAGLGMLRKPGMRAPVSRDVTTKAWEIYLLHPDEGQVAADAQAARDLLRYVGEEAR
jgi:hypothetical protein